jgi:hypothetical protein
MHFTNLVDNRVNMKAQCHGSHTNEKATFACIASRIYKKLPEEKATASVMIF